MDTIPVLLDTDIGSDIDDAVALAYLLRQPKCDLLGITTVTGQPDKRASLANAVCRAAGRGDIPVHVGTDLPLLVPARQTQAAQAAALTDAFPHQQYALENTAINFLRTTIRARPHQITLLAIGPLTNIALLFALDPEIPALLKEIVLMGGRFISRGRAGETSEWNILCDPHAAQRVFQSPVPRLIAVGLDVTEQCQMPADECRQRFTKAGGPLAVVGAMAEVWFKHTSRITFHDPLAAALIFEPSLCHLEAHRIRVELGSPDTLGQTLLAPPDDAHRHEIASWVDAAHFFEHYFRP